MSEGFRLRIAYRITDRLAFLSHLETIRSIERVIRRAGLPFQITEGFNPHMKIAFGPALPVGAGSACEYVDVRMREYVAPDAALAALQAAAPANLMPIACEYVAVNADAIDVAYPVSDWKVVFEARADRLDDIAAAFARLVDVGYIEVTKTKGRKTTTKRIDFADRLVDGPHLGVSGACLDADGSPLVTLEFSTFQGEGGALRPDKFIDAAFAGMDDAPAIRSLTRASLHAAA